MFNSKYSKFLTVLLVIAIIAIVALLGFFGYDLYNHRLVPNVGLNLTIGFTYTPKIFQWGK